MLLNYSHQSFGLGLFSVDILSEELLVTFYLILNQWVELTEQNLTWLSPVRAPTVRVDSGCVQWIFKLQKVKLQKPIFSLHISFKAFRVRKAYICMFVDWWVSKLILLIAKFQTIQLALCKHCLALRCVFQILDFRLCALPVQNFKSFLSGEQLCLPVFQVRDLCWAKLIHELWPLVDGVFLERKLVAELIVNFITLAFFCLQEFIVESVLLQLNFV